MKKVLIGLGIGCGSLLVIGAVAAVGFTYWAKGRMEEGGLSMEKLEETGRRTQAVQKRVGSLNQKYPFQAPPKGHPVRVEEDRLKEYLAVRAALVPAYQEFEQKMKALQPKEGEQPDLSAGFKMFGVIGELSTTLQEKWVAELDQRRMSPREYGAITAALYTSGLGQVAMQANEVQRAALLESKQQLDRRAADRRLTKAQRDEIRNQAKEIEAQIAALDTPSAGQVEIRKLHEHNAQLAEKYKADLDGYANPALDGMLMASSDEHVGEALNEILLGVEKEGQEGTE